jgi:hypothetical protein
MGGDGCGGVSALLFSQTTHREGRSRRALIVPGVPRSRLSFPERVASNWE